MMNKIKFWWPELAATFFIVVLYSWAATAGVSSHGPIASSGSGGGFSSPSSVALRFTNGVSLNPSVSTADCVAGNCSTDDLNVRTGAPFGTGISGSLNLQPGNATATSVDVGLVNITGTDASASSSLSGGALNITGGQSSGGTGGDVTVLGGSAGAAGGVGGNLILRNGSGDHAGTGADGLVKIGNNVATVGSKPAINSCGTGSPSVATGSNNFAGAITVGTGTPATCSITFSNNGIPSAHGVICVVSEASTVLGTKVTATTTTMTVTAAVTFTNGDVLNYICIGY